MANPQKENGFIPIAAEIYDSLCKIRIPGEARQIFDFIIRKTYGYGKKSDWISLSQFSDGTGLAKPNVVRAVKKLLSMRLIIQKDKGIIIQKDNVIQKDNGNRDSYMLTYSINKDYEKWRPLDKRKKTVIQKDNAPLSKRITTIDNNTIDNNTIQPPSPKPIKTAAGKPVKILHPDHKPTIEYWVAAYQKTFGVKYYFEGGKDAKIISDLLKIYKREELQRLMDKFLQTDDEFYIKVGYKLGLFRTQINQLKLRGINGLHKRRSILD